MSKKIVVITGSPRKNGNSFAMTEAFIKAAEGKGHTVAIEEAHKQIAAKADIYGNNRQRRLWSNIF